MADKQKKADREKTWEKVQVKAFTAWVNSYLSRRGKNIANLETDVCDGVLLLEFLEIAMGHKFKNIQRGDDIMRVHKIQNVGIALTYIQGPPLKVKLVSLGPEDIVDGNMKLILGLLWSLFRRMSIDTLENQDKSSEEGLLLWVKKITEGYKGVYIDKFTNSFSNGMALSAMIHAFDPSFVDYNSLDENDKEGNLIKAFDIAETKLGIPKLLEVNDLVEEAADERSVILYISLFFHAFVQHEEAKKRNEEREREKREREMKVTDLQSQLEESNARISRAAKDKDELEAANQTLLDLLKERERLAKELEDRHHDLLFEIEETKKKLTSEKERVTEKGSFLEDKVVVLTKVLTDNEEEKQLIEQKIEVLAQELDSTKESNKEVAAKQEQIVADVKVAQAKLEEEAKKRSKLKAEVEDLKKKAGKEVERRRQKAKALAELQKEVQALRKRAIVEAKARRGLDVLKKNLEEHLEDMYQWRDLHQLDTEGEKLEFILEDVLAELSHKSFEDQLETLNERLQGENKNLQRIIKLKDSQTDLKEIVEKEGYLLMKQKKSQEWQKAWFVLRGQNLQFYKDETLKSEIGKCPLSICQMIALKAEKVEDPAIKKVFITKITVENEANDTVYVGFKSLKEKSNWMIPLKSKLQQFAYIKAVEKNNSRPDTRILSLFSARDLKSCYLDNNPIPHEGVEAVTAILSLHDGLETVCMVNAKLGDSELKSIAEVLPKWKLKVLNLGNNKLSSEGASNIIKGLSGSVNEHLVELHLNDNDIDDGALQVLSDALPNLPKLKVINLSGNQIGDTGVKAYLEALAKAPNAIPSLALSNNNISDTGAADIASLLKTSSTIQSVHLAGNEIGDTGAEAVAHALHTNLVVDDVDFSMNRIGNKAALAFHKLLQHNKTIQTLNLSGNKGISGSEDIQALVSQSGFFFPSLIFTRVA